ncbi:hypothetical protein H5J22_10670 [Cetobacterium sp. 8H]|uniref:hypothetical protein n=1 Tax=Cetobacterium sp. 8H TaxID=2759681 RepID=UPI00163CEE9B|nr:hypothetical protein [Cetobacterium sp. 8H]MBC2851858.1 hypothetical protein [Cetobacterium sp. 8H]
MKKLLFIGTFIISALSFSADTTTKDTQTMMSGRPMQCETCPMMSSDQMMGQNKMMGKHMMNVTPEMQKEMQKEMILIKEKNLEIQKEMLENKVDWNKIEKLNKEIADIKAGMQTKMMKVHYDMMKTQQATPTTK